MTCRVRIINTKSCDHLLTLHNLTTIPTISAQTLRYSAHAQSARRTDHTSESCIQSQVSGERLALPLFIPRLHRGFSRVKSLKRHKGDLKCHKADLKRHKTAEHERCSVCDIDYEDDVALEISDENSVYPRSYGNYSEGFVRAEDLKRHVMNVEPLAVSVSRNLLNLPLRKMD